jgi:hypothetical protein
MKRRAAAPGFLQGVLLAAILGFIASALMVGLLPFIGFGSALRLLIPFLTLAYLLYLFSRSNVRTGRVSIMVVWICVAAASWWFVPPLSLYLLIHVASIWMVRSLYFHSSFSAASVDFALSAVSVAAAAWALNRSGSVFMASWCFFLLQSLFIAIPASIASVFNNGTARAPEKQNFERARREADKALQQLFTR